MLGAYADPEVDMILCAIGGDETYADEYKKLLIKIINDPKLPVLCNINIGHATPRCIIPFGVNATVDADRQVITFE